MTQPELSVFQIDGGAKANTLSQQIWTLGQEIAKLDPGALASLRRMSDPIGPPALWRLYDRCVIAPTSAPPGSPSESWSALIQAMAILTDKGRAEPGAPKTSPHSDGKPFGRALCDGGDASWGADGSRAWRPMLSELRFARLLASQGETRRALALRAARMLATKKPPRVGVNCVELFLFLHGQPKASAEFARYYYSRLDRAGRGAAEGQAGEE